MSRSSIWQLASFVFLSAYLSNASAAPIDLNDWAINEDGRISENFAGDSMPGNGDFSLQTGLGERTFEFSTPGAHSFTAFFDHEIDVQRNFFTNEYGVAHGSPASGQSWQLDEPGFVFGTIYDNMLAGSLNNTNSIPENAPEDLSMAMGWDFFLDAGKQAEVIVSLTQTRPDAGFYLEHTDPETGKSFDQTESLFFSSRLNITGAATQVPGPQSWILLLTGLIAGGFLVCCESHVRGKA